LLWSLCEFSLHFSKVKKQAYVIRTEEKPDQEPSRSLKVYRGPWTENLTRWWGFTDTAEEYVNPTKTIHGFYDFKDHVWSYALAHVPRDAVIEVPDNHRNDLTPRRIESATTGFSQFSKSTICERHQMIPARSGSSPQRAHYPVISASYSLPKALIAVAQLAFAIVTLYQSRGDQINQYGYAAFALTVIPYALMSFVNLLGNLLTPDYHALYLVGSDVMDEAISRGAQFDGVIGRLVQNHDYHTGSVDVLPPSHSDEHGEAIEFSYSDKSGTRTFPVNFVDYSTSHLPPKQRRKHITSVLKNTYHDLSPSVFIPTCAPFLRHRAASNSPDFPKTCARTEMSVQGTFSLFHVEPSGWRTVICFVNALVVFSIIGAITKFSEGTHASNAQLQWILHWYIFGTVYSGYGLEDLITWRRWPEPDDGGPDKRRGWLLALPLGLYGIPAIGGFVIVVQMLYAFGTCSFD
jgi:hypothetical protein